MDYPQRFFQRMFAWGRPLELSRRLAIYSGALVLLIAAAAGAIAWARRSQSAKPYFIYAAEGGEWLVYSEHLRSRDSETPWHRLMQESVAVKYARDYLRVPAGLADADDLWCKCGGDCGDGLGKCALCCASGSGIFDDFERNIMPEWRKKFGGGESAELEKIEAAALGEADERGGTWMLTGVLASSKSPAKKVTAFVRIERARGGRGQTLGYYVGGFDFYLE
ncbi:MAG: hypothetical protein LBL21_02245 [Rickettsiales bacterium]|jgi:hypothetical protein|nr:hypothetical protein [Rickettsiales bacterium]